jgi:hypothetical protein
MISSMRQPLLAVRPMKRLYLLFLNRHEYFEGLMEFNLGWSMNYEKTE